MRLLHYFDEVVVADTEFRPSGDGRQEVRCVCALELRSGRKHGVWIDSPIQSCPYPTGLGTAFVAHYASAELLSHFSLGWEIPSVVLDTCIEFAAMTAGKRTQKQGRGLLDALEYFGLDHISATVKDDMRDLVLEDRRNSEYSTQERADLIEYCWSDVWSIMKLLPKIEAFLCAR